MANRTPRRLLHGGRKVRRRADRLAVHEELGLSRLRVRDDLEGIPEIGRGSSSRAALVALGIHAAEISVGRDDRAGPPFTAREFRRAPSHFSGNSSLNSQTVLAATHQSSSPLQHPGPAACCRCPARTRNAAFRRAAGPCVSQSDGTLPGAQVTNVSHTRIP